MYEVLYEVLKQNYIWVSSNIFYFQKMKEDWAQVFATVEKPFMLTIKIYLHTLVM